MTVRCSLLASLLALGGCGHIETMMNRVAPPDDRIQLGPDNSTLYLTQREITDYTCIEHLLLVCERGASPKYACSCKPR